MQSTFADFIASKTTQAAEPGIDWHTVYYLAHDITVTQDLDYLDVLLRALDDRSHLKGALRLLSDTEIREVIERVQVLSE